MQHFEHIMYIMNTYVLVMYWKILAPTMIYRKNRKKETITEN